MKWSTEDFAQQIGAWRRQLAGMVRRVAVKLTSGGVWQVAGHMLFEGKRETLPIENYPGIGLYARPPASDSVEAVAVQVGGQNNPAIVATRDEATRAKVDDLDEDETALYNSEVRLYLTKDGKIEARTHGGTAHELALKSDVQTLRNESDTFMQSIYNTHTHIETGGATSIPSPVQSATLSQPVGTDKLLGE